jgi:hypothetical protein
LNRTFLLLLVVGLTIAAWQRNRSSPPAPNVAPVPDPKPALLSPTNSSADRSLASVAQAAQK